MEETSSEPPAKRFKVDAANKAAVIRNLANITQFQKEMSKAKVAKNLFDKSDIPEGDLVKFYEDKVQEGKEYEIYPPLDFVYYKFSTSRDEEDPGEGKKITASGFDPKLIFILQFRHHFRMVRRLVYFSYIQQGMIEECTRYNYLEQKIRHKFSESQYKTIKRSDHLARCMQLEDYTRFTDIKYFRIREVEPITETVAEGIPLLPKKRPKTEEPVEYEDDTGKSILGAIGNVFGLGGAT